MPFIVPVLAAIGGGSALAGGALAAGTAASLYAANKSSSAVKSAANTQAASDQSAINEQQRQFDATQANLMPFITGGQQAFGAEGNLLGLNGDAGQSDAIASLQNSPLYQSLYRNGQQTILANGAATGGLRGGNIQNSLAHFGSDTLSQVIQQQLSNLGGVANQGLGAAASNGQFGANASTNIGNLLTTQGNNVAGGTLGQAAIGNSSLQTLLSALGIGLGGIKQSGLFGGGQSSTGSNSILSQITNSNANANAGASLGGLSPLQL